jgi:hypothetical protein
VAYITQNYVITRLISSNVTGVLAMPSKKNFWLSTHSVDITSDKKIVITCCSSYASILFFDIFGLSSDSFLNSSLWHSQPA